MTYYNPQTDREELSIYRMISPEGKIETPDYMRAYLHTLKPEPGWTLKIWNPYEPRWEVVLPPDRAVVNNYFTRRLTAQGRC